MCRLLATWSLCIAFVFFFNDTATTEIYTLSLHDALPIYFITADYGSACDAAFSAVQQRPQAATPYLILTIARIGVGDLDGATSAFEQLETLAPEMTAARLKGAWLSPKENYRRRAQTFLRVAAGLAPMSEAVAQVADRRP